MVNKKMLLFMLINIFLANATAAENNKVTIESCKSYVESYKDEYFNKISSNAGNVNSSNHDYLLEKVFGCTKDSISKVTTKSLEETKEFLQEASFNSKVISLMSKTAESLSWYEYRKIFLTSSKIERGVSFWKEHKDEIKSASEAYKVNPEVIVSIIGVETSYGENLGRFNVRDSLFTLGFFHERRSDFFSSELIHYMKLCKEQELDPSVVKGSYAGAFGYGQFIPSSYNHYAVNHDMSKSKNIDLFDPADAIASVASYLQVHDWKLGEGVVHKLSDGSTVDKKYLWKKQPLPSEYFIKNKNSFIPSHIVQTVYEEQKNAHYMKLKVSSDGRYEYWVTLDNFYTITRYNHSNLYAMAVYQLSQEIKKKYSRSEAI